MAEDPGAYIRFAGGSGPLRVKETPAEVEQAILDIGPMHVPLVHLVLADGRPVTVNAALIKTISEPDPFG
jgi:hypothetical protein